VPEADVLTPNQFELDFLTGGKTETLADVAAATAALRKLGPRIVFVTSARTAETPENAIELLAADEEGARHIRLPRLPVAANGAGDLVAALFFAHYLRSSSIAEALSLSASAMFAVLARTADAGAHEMLLIESQQELVTPPEIFAAEPFGPQTVK
jgi:pyridoxine kinase